MSEAQEARRVQQWEQQFQQRQTSRADPNLWGYEDLQFLMQHPNLRSTTDFIKPGDRIDLSSLPQGTDLQNFLFSAGIGAGTSPDPKKGLGDWLRENGMTLQQYQDQYGGTALNFSPDGKTATYDPAFQRANFSYEPGPDWFETVMPGLILGMGGLGMMGMLPGTTSAFGAAGAGAAGAGAAEAGTFASSFAPTITPSTVAQAGMLGGASMPSVAGLSGVGGLTAEGMAALGAMGSAGAGLGAGTTGALGALGLDAAGSIIPSTMNLAASTGGAVAGATGANSLWSSLGKALGLSEGTTSALGGIGQFGGSLLEWLQSKDNASALEEMLNAAAERGDPFGSQRPFYQGMLKDSYTNPDFFKNNPVFQGLNSAASSDAQRVAAARGFNNSSNLIYDVADRVQKTGYNYANQFQGQLGQLAGGGISPGTSAQIAANGANQVTQANQQSNGALGATLGNLPNLINGIKGLV